MKPFQFFIYRSSPMPPELGIALFGIKPRMIGITYEKNNIVGVFGVENTITIWLWKYWKKIIWIKK